MSVRNSTAGAGNVEAVRYAVEMAMLRPPSWRAAVFATFQSRLAVATGLTVTDLEPPSLAAATFAEAAAPGAATSNVAVAAVAVPVVLLLLLACCVAAAVVARSKRATPMRKGAAGGGMLAMLPGWLGGSAAPLGGAPRAAVGSAGSSDMYDSPLRMMGGGAGAGAVGAGAGVGAAGAHSGRIAVAPLVNRPGGAVVARGGSQHRGRSVMSDLLAGTRLPGTAAHAQPLSAPPPLTPQASQRVEFINPLAAPRGGGSVAPEAVPVVQRGGARANMAGLLSTIHLPHLPSSMVGHAQPPAVAAPAKTAQDVLDFADMYRMPSQALAGAGGAPSGTPLRPSASLMADPQREDAHRGSGGAGRPAGAYTPTAVRRVR